MQKHRVLQQRYGPFDARQFAEVCDTFSRLRARHAKGKPAGAPGGSARVGGGGGAREFGVEVLDFVFPGKKYVSVTGSVAAGQNNAAAATAGATFAADSKPVDEFGDMTKKLKALLVVFYFNGLGAFDRGERRWPPGKSQGLSAKVGTKAAKASEPNLSDSLRPCFGSRTCARRGTARHPGQRLQHRGGRLRRGCGGAELYELLGDSAIEMISEISQSLLEIGAKLKVCLLYAYRKDQEARRTLGAAIRTTSLANSSPSCRRGAGDQEGRSEGVQEEELEGSASQALSWLQTVGIDYLLQLVTEEPDPSPRDVPVMKDPAEFDLDDYVGKGASPSRRAC